MRSVLTWFTVRGASFLAAGIVGILAGLTLGSDAMVSVGVLLICLPVFSALTARRARYQLRCERRIDPPRVTPGQPATVTIRLENVSRISTGLLLAEETIPYSLGARPRYVLNGIERGGAREVSYPLRPARQVRGRPDAGQDRRCLRTGGADGQLRDQEHADRHPQGHGADLGRHHRKLVHRRGRQDPDDFSRRRRRRDPAGLPGR